MCIGSNLHFFLSIKHVDPVYNLRIIFLVTDCKNFDLPFHNIALVTGPSPISPEISGKIPGNCQKKRENKSHNILLNFIIILVTTEMFYIFSNFHCI